MLSRLFVVALWSPAGKGLIYRLLVFVMFDFVFVTFPCGILGQVWYLIVSIPDLCSLFTLSTRLTSDRARHLIRVSTICFQNALLKFKMGKYNYP